MGTSRKTCFSIQQRMRIWARVEYDSDDRTVIRRRTFACRCDRNYEPKKDITSDNIHNRTSTKTGWPHFLFQRHLQLSN